MLPATKHSFDSTCWRISICPRCRPVTGWFGVLRWFSFSSWHGCSWWFALDNPRKATGKKDEKRKEHKPLHTKAVHMILHAFYFFLFRVEIQHTFHTLALTWKALETRGLNCFQGTVLELKLNCSMDWVVLTTALIKSYGAAASWFLGLRISCGDCLTGWNFFFCHLVPCESCFALVPAD